MTRPIVCPAVVQKTHVFDLKTDTRSIQTYLFFLRFLIFTVKSYTIQTPFNQFEYVFSHGPWDQTTWWSDRSSPYGGLLIYF